MSDMNVNVSGWLRKAPSGTKRSITFAHQNCHPNKALRSWKLYMSEYHEAPLEPGAGKTVAAMTATTSNLGTISSIARLHLCEDNWQQICRESDTLDVDDKDGGDSDADQDQTERLDGAGGDV